MVRWKIAGAEYPPKGRQCTGTVPDVYGLFSKALILGPAAFACMHELSQLW